MPVPLLLAQTSYLLDMEAQLLEKRNMTKNSRKT